MAHAADHQTARLNYFRLNAARLNVYPFVLSAAIDGVDVTAFVRIEGAAVTHQLNHVLDTASVRVSGIVPTAGRELVLALGDTSDPLFRGRITEVTTLYEGVDRNVAYDLHALDPTWLLARQKVLAKYTNQSASAIAIDLVAKFTRGVTTAHVAPGLPVLDEIVFTHEEVADCFSRLAERIGGYWYLDYASDLHLFLDEGDAAGPITQSAPRGSRNHQLREDLSQVATAIIGRGGGSQAAVDLPVGATLLPVDEAIWYSATGGLVETGSQRLTYTGLVGTTETGAALGDVAVPPAPVLIANASGSPSLAPGTYRVARTWYTSSATNETTISAEAIDVIVAGPPGHNQLAIRLSDTLDAPPDPAVKGTKIYISDTNGGTATLKLYSGAIPYPYPPGLGGVLIYFNPPDRTTPPPSTSTAGISGITVQPGATSVLVTNLAAFTAPGWALAPGGQPFSYTGKSAATGIGYLTGIPATGSGAITAPFKSGTVRMIPALTGLPASGTGAIVYPIKKGDEISLRYEESDAAAAAAMATRFNLPAADGVIAEVVTDGRFGLTELTATVRALLSDRKTPTQTVTFESRDTSLEVGRLVTLSLTTPPIAGTFRITQVAFSEIAIQGRAYPTPLAPLRRVTATNKVYSFADLLRRFRTRSTLGGAA